MATAQLQLIDTEGLWKLDRRTVEIGKAGVAKARAALAAATALAEAEQEFENAQIEVDTEFTHPVAA